MSFNHVLIPAENNSLRSTEEVGERETVTKPFFLKTEMYYLEDQTTLENTITVIDIYIHASEMMHRAKSEIIAIRIQNC